MLRKLTLALVCICTAALPARAVLDFTFEAVDLVGTGGDWSFMELKGNLTNTGDERDTYDIHKEEWLPAGWMASICVGENCYAPDVFDVSHMLNPGESTYVKINFTIATTVGTGVVNMSVRSQGDPMLSASLDYAGAHTGCDLLIVDDRSSHGDGMFFAQSMASLLTPVAGVWPRHAEAPLLADLQAFPMVLWLTGTKAPGLDQTDRGLVGDYLAGDGPLLLAGQDLAFELCDTNSVYQSEATVDWFESTLGLAYRGESASTDVAGVPGDFIGCGLASSFLPGYVDPDVVVPALAGPAAVSLRYGDGQAAAITRTQGMRFAYFGFAPEAAPAIEGALLNRAVELLGGTTGAGGVPALARLTLRGNAPNPFNPETAIHFAAPAAGTARIEVLDLRGRLLRRFEAPVMAGENAVPFLAVDEAGRDLPSGVYLYRVRLGEEVAAGKMTLLK
ncbi:MAG: hypothetical protein JW819_03130 [Candidatus Krumholzibacteriota bacterium]|nr:hypothetical protein [Candidatus Krumholzibacteriota bacterium]